MTRAAYQRGAYQRGDFVESEVQNSEVSSANKGISANRAVWEAVT